MLMPIFAIGVKCLYTTFNPNAKDSYYGETINDSTQTNYQPQNLSLNKEYYLTNVLLPNNDYPSMVSSSNLFSVILLETDNPNLEPFLNVGSYMRFYRGTGNVGSNTQYSVYFSNNVNFDNSVTYGISTTYTNKLLINSYTWNISTTYEFEPFYTIEYNDYSYIDNVFYYSVVQINNEPLFSWAQSSFLSQPLLFITNFFGVPSTSPILTILCYWFSISVIWLVFDAVMYFPLLIHRWLDKGVIE